MLSSYDRFIRGKRWKSQGTKSGQMMVGDPTPSETLQEPLCCSWIVRPSTVMKKDNIWGQYSSSLVLNKGIELQHEFHIWRETIVLGMFTGSLRCQNWQVRCVAIEWHTRDITQHIRAKFHLILTVVLISRPIGSWKYITLIVNAIICGSESWGGITDVWTRSVSGLEDKSVCSLKVYTN